MPIAPPPSSSGQIRRLVTAQRQVTADRDLPVMLKRIVAASCTLVGAHAATFAILGDTGLVAQEVRYGDGDVRRAVGDYPDGSCLDVAVCVRGAVFGRLHLVRDEPGGFEPGAHDLVTALACFAGSAIDNALLHEEAQRSKDWLHASGEIARALLADADTDGLMEVVSRALHVAEADYAALILPTIDGLLKTAITVGLGAQKYAGLIFEPDDTELGRAIVRGRSLITTEMASVADDEFDNEFRYGPTMAAPLVDAHGVRGSVVLIRTAGRAPFAARDLDLATTFADQVAIALQLNDARLDTQSLHLLENRHEVSRALHDSVIQRLFATGMGLQGLADRDLPEELTERLRRHIGDLDETIEQIRARVFEAQPGDVHGGENPDRFLRVPRDGVPLPVPDVVS